MTGYIAAPARPDAASCCERQGHPPDRRHPGPPRRL